jgi:hypothetical protein
MKQFGRFLAVASLATAAAARFEGLAGNKKATLELKQAHILVGAAVGVMDLLV